MKDDEKTQLLRICHTMKSHFSARSMAIYLLRKKLTEKSALNSVGDQAQDIAEILTVLESSFQKELSLVEQLEQLGKGLTEDAETEA